MPTSGEDVDAVDPLDGRGKVAELDIWQRAIQGHRSTDLGDVLPPHSPMCAGCGPVNTAGLGLTVESTDVGVRAIHSFDDRQTGAPGIVHGGLVATAYDDLFGFLLYSVRQLAVTRSLTVEYLRPIWLHQPYEFTASIDQHIGRRLHVSAQARSFDGEVHGTAEATFITVDLDHFAQ